MKRSSSVKMIWPLQLEQLPAETETCPRVLLGSISRARRPVLVKMSGGIGTGLRGRVAGTPSALARGLTAAMTLDVLPRTVPLNSRMLCRRNASKPRSSGLPKRRSSKQQYAGGHRNDNTPTVSHVSPPIVLSTDRRRDTQNRVPAFEVCPQRQHALLRHEIGICVGGC
jgi:hypothetical protein